MPPQTTSPYGERILAWEAPEYAQHEKSERWYLVSGVFVVSMVGYGLMSGQYSMSIAFALLAAVYHLIHAHPARRVTIEITNLGMMIAGRFYSYGDLQEFWIVYDPPAVERLYVRPRGRWSHDLGIELAGQDPQLIRSLLETQVREIVGKKESTTQRLARLLNL